MKVKSFSFCFGLLLSFMPVGKDHGKNVESGREHSQQITQIGTGFDIAVINQKKEHNQDQS